MVRCRVKDGDQDRETDSGAELLAHVDETGCRARIEDVSRLLGHSTVRVTQDLYIAPDADLYDRFYQATA